MQIVDKNCGRAAKPPSATAIAAIIASIGCIDARDKRVLAVLSTKMSSEEVLGDTSLIFVHHRRGKSMLMDSDNDHHRRH